MTRLSIQMLTCTDLSIESDPGEAGKIVAPSLIWEIKILQEQSISSLRDSEGEREKSTIMGKNNVEIFPN